MAKKQKPLQKPTRLCWLVQQRQSERRPGRSLRLLVRLQLSPRKKANCPKRTKAGFLDYRKKLNARLLLRNRAPESPTTKARASFPLLQSRMPAPLWARRFGPAPEESPPLLPSCVRCARRFFCNRPHRVLCNRAILSVTNFSQLIARQAECRQILLGLL